MKSTTWLLNRHVLAALCATPLLIGSASVFADEAAAPVDAAPAAEAAPAAAAAPAEAAPPYTLTFNLGVITQYVGRGVTYSNGPAIQGGVDWAHSSGFYLGAWASSANPLSLGGGTDALPTAPNGAQLGRGNHVETDWYGGYAHAFGPVTLGIGGNYVWYPEGEKSYHDRNQDTFEGNVNISAYGFTYTFYHAFTSWYGIGNLRDNLVSPGTPTAAGSLESTKGVEYHELKYGYALPIGGLNFAAKVGYQRSDKICLNQKDYLIGLSRSFAIPTAGKPIDGFSAGANFTGTFDEEQCSKDGLYWTDNNFEATNQKQLVFFIKRSW
jgi:uncharacterized protein (TIGR02001 family)